MNLINVGKIVNTFGIKGELKIVNKFERPDLIFKVNNQIFINNNNYIISNVRFHKNNYLVEVNNLKDINLVEHLIGYDVYIERNNLKLDDKEYLISELIDYEVISNNLNYGKVSDYDDNLINPLIKVDNILVPLKGYFKDIDKDNKIIYLEDISGLRL